jgi:hypothetical protein
VYAFLQVAGFGETAQWPYLWLMAAGIIFLLILFAGYLFWVGSGAALRSAGLAALVFLFVFTWGVTWRLNFVDASNPVEIMAHSPTSTHIRDLVSTLEQLSAWRSGDRHELPVDVVGLRAPAFSWYLRNFRNVMYTDVPTEEGEMPVYVTTESQDPKAIPAAYRGQRFTIRSDWPAAGLRGAGLIRWWLYREASTAPVDHRVVLWSQNGGAPGLQTDN